MQNRVRSTLKPFDFITKAEKPGKIGIVPISAEHGAWYRKQDVLNHISKIEADLKFWNEVLQQFSE